MSSAAQRENSADLQLWANAAARELLPTTLGSIHDSGAVSDRNGFTIALGDLAPGDMVLPSFSALAESPWHYQCTLNNTRLLRVPSKASAKGTPSSEKHGAITTHLDWFEVLQPISGATLKVDTTASAIAAPNMLAVSIRPVHQATASVVISQPVATPPPPAISQKQAEAELRDRICSPTSVAMVLAQYGLNTDWQAFVAQCRDPATGMYGMWPLSVLRAAQAGSLGMVRTFRDWNDALPLLAANIPIIASIRYPKDGLPGSPMPSTGGHLVVVYGVDDAQVLVNDPAAPEHSTVPRRYPRAAFERAWFDHRGAGYVLLPPCRA